MVKVKIRTFFSFFFLLTFVEISTKVKVSQAGDGQTNIQISLIGDQL